jgi:hypothetical protein
MRMLLQEDKVHHLLLLQIKHFLRDMMDTSTSEELQILV